MDVESEEGRELVPLIRSCKRFRKLGSVVNALNAHQIALGLAREAMLADSATGCSLGAWRDGVVEICRFMGVSEPEDVLAWVSGGKSSDLDVKDWSRKFSVS